MALKYLMDENIDPIYPNQIRSKQVGLIIRVIGEPSIPAKGTKDPEILEWCEKYDFILVTNNRKSMPVHLNDHLQANRHIPGIFILNASLSVGQNIDELILIAECSFFNEYQDQIIHLPITKEVSVILRIAYIIRSYTRPLVYHFRRDWATYHLYDQVLLGPSLMAAPVYRPGVEHRAVYLPEGTWYDWWTGECYQGPTHILAYAPLERMPLYVRGGGIIAIAPVRQFVSEEPLESLKMRIWPGSGEWTLYEDDGHSFEHEKGVWATTNYKVYLEGEKIIVEIVV